MKYPNYTEYPPQGETLLFRKETPFMHLRSLPSIDQKVIASLDNPNLKVQYPAVIHKKQYPTKKNRIKLKIWGFF
jgi:hypothetical protein